LSQSGEICINQVAVCLDRISLQDELAGRAFLKCYCPRTMGPLICPLAFYFQVSLPRLALYSTFPVGWPCITLCIVHCIIKNHNNTNLFRILYNNINNAILMGLTMAMGPRDGSIVTKALIYHEAPPTLSKLSYSLFIQISSDVPKSCLCIFNFTPYCFLKDRTVPSISSKEIPFSGWSLTMTHLQTTRCVVLSCSPKFQQRLGSIGLK